MKAKYLLSIIVACAAFVAPLFLESEYLLYSLLLLTTNMTLAVSWFLIGGMCGQILLGQAAFFGLGAYTAVLLWRETLQFWLAILASGATAALLALAMTPLFKLRGVYFAVGSFFLNVLAKEVAINWVDVTGGSKGIGFQPPFPSYLHYYYMTLAISVSFVYLSYKIYRSKFGFAIRAIKGGEDVAVSLGIRPITYKLCTLIIIAVFTGVAGGIYSLSLAYIEPQGSFSMQWALNGPFMAIIGGLRNLIGPLLGALLLTTLNQLLVIAGGLHMLFSGLILILVIRFAPAGLFSLIEVIARKLRHIF